MFGGKDKKEDKKQERINEVMKQFKLDELSGNSADIALKIATELYGNNLGRLSIALQGKTEDVMKLSYLQAIVEQNWLIINLLNKISNK